MIMILCYIFFFLSKGTRDEMISQAFFLVSNRILSDSKNIHERIFLCSLMLCFKSKLKGLIVNLANKEQ